VVLSQPFDQVVTMFHPLAVIVPFTASFVRGSVIPIPTFHPLEENIEVLS